MKLAGYFASGLLAFDDFGRSCHRQRQHRRVESAKGDPRIGTSGVCVSDFEKTVLAGVTGQIPGDLLRHVVARSKRLCKHGAVRGGAQPNNILLLCRLIREAVVTCEVKAKFLRQDELMRAENARELLAVWKT